MMTFLADRLPALDSRFCLLLTWACLTLSGKAVCWQPGLRSSAECLPDRRPTPATRPACSLCS